MRRATTLIIATSMLAACAGRSLGPRATAGAHQERQRDRIQGGVESGELTNREARDLRHQQRDIKADRQAARADGVVTRKERRRIQQQQDEASKAIYEQKHDDDTR